MTSIQQAIKSCQTRMLELRELERRDQREAARMALLCAQRRVALSFDAALGEGRR